MPYATIFVNFYKNFFIKPLDIVEFNDIIILVVCIMGIFVPICTPRL